ncbi:MAG: TetR/AcrR family transcriptional regulator [Acidimicrobiales bacterium]
MPSPAPPGPSPAPPQPRVGWQGSESSLYFGFVTIRLSAEERRRQVLAAAIDEFAKGGLHGTSTEDIARAAGISQPYLFRLFPTKKSLFLAAVEKTFDRAREVLLGAAGDRSGPEALAAMGAQYRVFLENRTLLLTQMHAFAACDDADIRLLTQTCFGRLWRELGEVAGVSDEDVATFVARGMLLNVAASMNLGEVADMGWVKACLGSHLPYATAGQVAS